MNVCETEPSVIEESKPVSFDRSVVYCSRGEYPVYSFGSSLKPYSVRGLCLKLPKELSVVVNKEMDARTHLWLVSLYMRGEEHTVPKYIFHKYLRIISGYDCIPIPAAIVEEIEDVMWTVVISPLGKYMLKQFDGFVYPEIVVDGLVLRYDNYGFKSV